METLFERYKNLLVLIGVLLVQFVALAVQVRTPSLNGEDGKSVRLLRHWVVALVAPPEKAVVSTGSGVRGFWGNYIDLRHARDENEALRDENNRLRLEQAGLLEDARQGQRLQALLSFKQHYVYQTEPAQVIGTGGSDQSRVLYIDKGAKDGLAIDQPVITPDGIVGKVKEVFPHTAQVLEISDQTSGAGVLLEKTRLRGVLRGNAYGQPQVIDILPDERIKAGEAVLTSGGDQIFPRGLPVGTVEKVVSDPEREPYVDIVIKPAANLQHLEEVLVVTQTSDQLPEKTQKDLARSQAVSAAEAEKQRASDILAEKLPGLNDPNGDPGASAEQKPTGGEEVGRPIQPPQPLHADRYSPNTVPPANALTPGKAAPKAQGGGSVADAPAAKTPASKPATPRTEAHGPATGPSASTVAQDEVARPAGDSTPKAAVAGTKPATLTAPNAATPKPVAAAPAEQAPAGGPANGTAAIPIAKAVTTAPKSTVNAASAKDSPQRPTTAYVEPKWVGKRADVQKQQQEQPQ